MAKEELFRQIAHIFTGFVKVEETTDDWFIVLVRGCVFPSEVVRVRELCYVSMISYDVSRYCMEVHCKYVEDYECK